LANEKKSYTGLWQLKELNLAKGWLPTLDANGSFIYNSSVVNMSDVIGNLPVPGIADLITPLPHEQYKVTLEINQMIYDGGAIKGTKKMEKAELAIHGKQTEADLYKLRGQVNNCYFNLMLLDRQEELFQNFLEVVEKRISSVKAAMANGVMMKSDGDVLLAEKIRIGQQLSENHIRKESFLKILSGLTGMEIDTSDKFMVPVTDGALTNEMIRPELELFDLRKEQLDVSKQLIQSKRMPKAFGFATLGYGNPPGSNFFRDEFAPFYVVGAGIRWNLFDWDKAKTEKQVIALQQDILGSRKNDLTDQIQRLLDTKKSEISALESMLNSDRQLIEVRKRITGSAESQYENGTITATEYLNELNAERQALINAEIHKISLSLAKVEYLNICGKEIE
jgi:outer membrane protein TolC